MKPSFALKFSHTGIELLHRVSGGWQRVADISFDDPELDEKLKVARKTANLLEAGRLACKLVIPNSQILYTTVTAPGPGKAERFEQIRSALDGLTPYAADELTFDWEASGDRCAVAAVASETLSEAEEFATRHKFNPVSFVAIPEAGNFRGEPFFGLAAAADAVLDGAEVVDRDSQSIVILGDAKAQAAGPDKTPGASPDQGTRRKAAPRREPTFQSRRDEAGLAAEDAAIKEVMATPARISFVPVGPPLAGAKQTPPPAPSAHAPNAGKETKAAPPVGPQDVLVLASENGSAAAKAPAKSAETGAEKSADKAPDKAKAPEKAPKPAPVARKAPQKAPQETPPLGAAIAPATPAGNAAASTLSRPADEAEALTIFGARNRPSAPRARLRTWGVLVVAALLAILVAIAIWATLMSPRGLATLFEGPPPAVAMDPEEAADQANNDLALLGPPPPDPQGAPAVEVVSPAPDQPINVPPQDPASLDRASPAPGVLVDGETARAFYAKTGIWQLPPAASPRPEEDGLDNLYIASIEPLLSSQDAVALPEVEGPHDAPPLAMPSPAPFGTRFVLDAKGRVVPTPEGTMSPDGVMIYAGRPPTPPRNRPGTAPPPQALPEAPKIAATPPRARPGNLIEKAERSQFAGRSRKEMAALRPSPRPNSPQNDAAVDQAPTKQAVSRSRTPAKRPSNMVVLVALARANDAGAKKSVEQQAKEAAPRVAMTTPPAATVAPSVPTRASVARRATQADAIHLRKVNLIGVYGTPNQRRALVRLSSGRYIKVSVGDKVDGGKVTTIGETELRYVKRGRNIVLKMPSG